jgi:hypothetical protein
MDTSGSTALSDARDFIFTALERHIRAMRPDQAHRRQSSRT